MNVLVPALAVLTAITVSAPIVHVSHRQPSVDSLVIDLRSTVPGREVEFRITGLSKGLHLTAAQLSTRADTLFATTPAQLWIANDVVGENLLIDIRPGEPWLHASALGASRIDLWGGQLSVNRASGHPVLEAAVLTTRDPTK